MMRIEEKALKIEKSVKFRARRRLLAGDFINPYPWDSKKHSEIIKGCFLVYQIEIDSFLNERLCPCCGQFTMGDIDW